VTEGAAQTWHYGLVARWGAEFKIDGIELRAGYEDRSPTSCDDFVVFIAKKPLA